MAALKEEAADLFSKAEETLEKAMGIFSTAGYEVQFCFIILKWKTLEKFKYHGTKKI